MGRVRTYVPCGGRKDEERGARIRARSVSVGSWRRWLIFSALSTSSAGEPRAFLSRLCGVLVGADLSAVEALVSGSPAAGRGFLRQRAQTAPSFEIQE